MADATTKLVIEAQTKGLAEATRSAAQLESSLSNVSKSAALSGRKMRDAIKEMSGQIRSAQKDNTVLAAGFKSQGDALSKLQEQYKAVTKQMAAMRQEASKGVEQDKKATEEVKKQSVFRRMFGGGAGGGGGSGPPGGGFAGGAGGGRGAFGQGFLQGVLPEAFIQRGPGALAQAGGAVAGRLVRGVAGAGAELLTSPLAGSQAAVSALGRIPFAGALAGGLQQSLSLAQAEMQTRASLQSVMPFLRAPGGADAMSTLAYTRSKFAPTGHVLGGMNATQTTAAIAQMAAAGGGIGDRYSDRSIRQALGAQAGLGLDVGTAGIFARGDTLGAAGASGQGSGPSTLAKSIADAFALKLEGSEVTQYLQSIAGNMSNFAATGIKVDETSRGGISRLMQAAGGYTGTRAAALSGGVTATMSEVASSGPQNAGQFLLLKQYGYDPQRPESLYAAMEEMDKADPGRQASAFAGARGDVMKMLRGQRSYRKGASYRVLMDQMGSHLRLGEARRESGQMLSPAQISAAMTPPDAAEAIRVTEESASRTTFDSTKKMAGMSEDASATGGAYIKSMIQMDAQSKQTLKTLSVVGSKFLDFAAKTTAFANDILSESSSSVGMTAPMTPQ